MEIKVYPDKVCVFEVNEENEAKTLIQTCTNFKKFAELFHSRKPSKDDFDYWRSRNFND